MDLALLYPQGLFLSCTDGVADVLALIDPSIAPSFLYYAYVPIIFLVLLLSLFISVSKAEDSLKRHLFWVGILFAILMGIETFLWIGIPAYLIHFAWEIVPIINGLFVFLIVSFAYRFLTKAPMPRSHQWVLLLLTAPLFLFASTELNLSLFNISTCESTQSILWSYMYALEFSLGMILCIMGIGKFSRSQNDPDRTKYLFFGAGILFFMGTKVLGDIVALHEVNYIWPIGMVGFLAVLAYIAIQYKEFNVRIFSAQVVLVALASLIFAALFVRTIENVRLVLLGTLVFVIVLGGILVQSVRREIRQKEENLMLAQELAKTNERLKQLDQQKSEFLSIATHQLRGPLAAIRGHLSLLLDGSYGALPEQSKKIIEKVFASGTLMTETVNDFLDVSRIEQGSMQYEMTDFSVGGMVTDIVEELQVSAHEKNLQLYAVHPVAEASVHADYGKIRHIFFNLIDNAIKYTPEGFVRIQVEEKNSSIFIRVTDSGIGISPEKIHMLFQKFVRMREASGINISGTGLGLYVAKQMVEAHKGSIWAESEGLGKGTTFVVQLPLRVHETKLTPTTTKAHIQ